MYHNVIAGDSIFVSDTLNGVLGPCPVAGRAVFPSDPCLSPKKNSSHQSLRSLRWNDIVAHVKKSTT